MRYAWVAAVFILLVLASGCTTDRKSEIPRNETTEFEYYNVSEGLQGPLVPKGDFTFKIHGENEFWIRPNKSVRFYVVFNNVDDDGEAHEFIARLFPSAADFDVMAAYRCLHFTTCDKLLEDMNSFINQTRKPILINYTFVGIYTIGIRIPEHAVPGTYMFNMVACEDMPFEKCTETTTNWGPNIPVIVHVF